MRVPTKPLTVENIAAIIHEANRQMQRITGELLNKEWGYCPVDLRNSVISGVNVHLASDVSPEASHNSWCAYKLAEGWVYGPVKDFVAKTHPNLVRYDELPPVEALKDVLFRGIVMALSEEQPRSQSAEFAKGLLEGRREVKSGRQS